MRIQLAGALLLAACSSTPKYVIDDALLAQIPINEKQGVLNAQNDANVAKEEMRKAESDLISVNRDLDLADNEYKQTKLALDSAEINQKGAQGDLNRKATADRDVQIAKMGKRSADAKVSYFEKKKKWIKADRDAAEAHHTAALAAIELEKARIAVAHNMKPSEDFSVANFERESFDKQRKASEARVDVDKLKIEMEDLERKWRSMEGEYQGAKGGQQGQQGQQYQQQPPPQQYQQ